MLQSTAQELFVIDQVSPASQLPASDDTDMAHDFGKDAILEVVEAPSEGGHHDSPMAFSENHPGNIEIIVEEIPGAANPEPLLEVQEEPEKTLKVEEKEDSNEAKKSKKPEKWDWESHGPHGFVAWIAGRLADVPKHSGQDSSGLQRAQAYLEKLDNEISKAMRMDLDGELDANKVEEIRSKIDDGLSRLQDRLEKVMKTKKSNRKKKGEEEQQEIVKEAQKILGVGGTSVMVPYLISVLARTCINSMVSGGHAIEHTYKAMCEKHKLDAREKFQLINLLYDMGMTIRMDRGLLSDEGEHDLSSSDNFDWSASFTG